MQALFHYIENIHLFSFKLNNSFKLQGFVKPDSVIIIVIFLHFCFDFSLRTMQLAKCDGWNQSKNIGHGGTNLKLDILFEFIWTSKLHSSILHLIYYVFPLYTFTWSQTLAFEMGSCNLRSCQMWDYGWLFAKSVLSLCAQRKPNFNQCVCSSIWKRQPAYRQGIKCAVLGWRWVCVPFIHPAESW